MQARGFDLRALDIFRAVAELGGMTAAGQRLGMTQPAVSQAVRGLEEALGVRLIMREHRPLALTAAGEWLLRAGSQVLNDADQIALTIRRFGDENTLRLRIGIVDSLAEPFVPAMIHRLAPSVQSLAVSAGFVRILRAGLFDRTLDIVLSNDPMEESADILKLPILTEPYLLVVPASLDPQLANLPYLASALPMIRWNSRTQTGVDIETQFRRLRFDLPKQFEFDTARPILGMVASGLGWAIMTPLSVFEMLAVQERVRLLPFPGPAFSRTVSVIARRNENNEIAEQIARTSSRILLDLYAPKVVSVAPWLRFDLDKNGYLVCINRVPTA